MATFQYNLLTKSSNFSANDGTCSFYEVTSTATITLPASAADGSVMKFKITGGTATLTCSGSEHIFRADGSQDTSLDMFPNSGCIELVAVSGGYDET